MSEEIAQEKGTPVRQFSVMLENRVGALSALVGLLRQHHVEVIGLSVVDSVDVTIVRLVVSDASTVREVFLEKGVPHSLCDLVVVELREGVSQLGRCLQLLLEAEINIHFSYGLLVRPRGRPLLALNLEDRDFAIGVLDRNGFTTMCENDLAR
ncbi:MAG TPA: acetolactate synthase [Verrucomicrobiales bacterium]|nr:acetolactate synthase [Verrucomicrobiales bacterium]